VSRMTTYRIHLIWSMYGHVDVEADSQEQAIEIALGPNCPLPDGEYVDDSVQVDDLIGIEAFWQTKGVNENA
jgi:hypothetical protein